jgi:hypothetical protein
VCIARSRVRVYCQPVSRAIFSSHCVQHDDTFLNNTLECVHAMLNLQQSQAPLIVMTIDHDVVQAVRLLKASALWCLQCELLPCPARAEDPSEAVWRNATRAKADGTLIIGALQRAACVTIASSARLVRR